MRAAAGQRGQPGVDPLAIERFTDLGSPGRLSALSAPGTIMVYPGAQLLDQGETRAQCLPERAPGTPPRGRSAAEQGEVDGTWVPVGSLAGRRRARPCGVQGRNRPGPALPGAAPPCSARP